MATMTGHHKIADEICRALGIEHATSLDIHMATNEIVTCTVTYHADEKDMVKLPTLLKKFKLVPIEEETIDENGFASGGLLPEKSPDYYSKLLHGPR